MKVQHIKTVIDVCNKSGLQTDFMIGPIIKNVGTTNNSIGLLKCGSQQQD